MVNQTTTKHPIWYLFRKKQFVGDFTDRPLKIASESALRRPRGAQFLTVWGTIGAQRKRPEERIHPLTLCFNGGRYKI